MATRLAADVDLGRTPTETHVGRPEAHEGSRVEAIVDRVLNAFRKFPKASPGRVNPELQHIQDILNRFRDTAEYYYEYGDDGESVFDEKRDLIDLVKAISDRGCKEYSRAAAMKRLIIPDVLEHAQYVPEAAERVTLIAHMTEDRLPRLEEILSHWNGPVSIAIYINIDHVRDLIRRVLDIGELRQRDNVLLHIVPEQGVIYPVNFLRNAAINNTKTRYVFLSDIDFVPVIGSHNILLEDLQSTTDKRQVFVIPAFEEKSTDYEFPQSKRDLLLLWEKDILVPFHLDKFPPGHHRTDFPRWKHAQSPYQIEWEPLFEPYIAGQKDALPRYSQAFVGRGMNKIQQIVETVAMGFELFVEPEIFIVHLKHERSRLTSGQDHYVQCSNDAMRKFNKYIFDKYGFTGQ